MEREAAALKEQIEKKEIRIKLSEAGADYWGKEALNARNYTDRCIRIIKDGTE
jgi:hypothetical protein